MTSGKPPMTWAVESALSRLDKNARDVAAEALARRYAHDIDEAAVISEQAARVLRDVRKWMDPVLYDRISVLFDRIESTAVLALLGPKLLVVLTELGMTPRARADVTRKGGAGTNAPPTGSPLAKLRGERVAGLKTS